MQRADNDTWDLATSVGATATMVAAGRARATLAQDRLIDDRFAAPLVRAVGIDFFTRWATGELDSADVDLPDAPWGMQRMTEVLAARTRYFDAFFADATAAGIRQAVILASGLDARGYRLSWPDTMTVFEIDQPEVIDFKTATLTELGARAATDLRSVRIDLRDDWPTALCDVGFDPGRPTAWIAEGLLAFLPPVAQDRLLDDITALSAGGSRLAAEIFMNSADADIERAREQLEAVTARWRQHGLHLEFADLHYPGERNDVATYLDDRGWSSQRTPLSQLLAASGLPAMPHVDGEVSLGENYYCISVKNPAD